MNKEDGARAKGKKPRRQPRAVALGGLVAVAVVAAVLLGGWTNSTSARATTSAKKAAAQAVTLYVFRGRMSRPSWIFGDGLGLGQAASSL
jgi:hypothetical protein